MIGWHHPLGGHEFEQTLGEMKDREACCSPWGHKELDMTERLNNNLGTRRVFSFFDYPRESGENPQGLRLTSCQSGVWVLSHIKLSWETFK